MSLACRESPDLALCSPGSLGQAGAATYHEASAAIQAAARTDLSRTAESYTLILE